MKREAKQDRKKTESAHCSGWNETRYTCGMYMRFFVRRYPFQSLFFCCLFPEAESFPAPPGTSLSQWLRMRMYPCKQDALTLSGQKALDRDMTQTVFGTVPNGQTVCKNRYARGDAASRPFFCAGNGKRCIYRLPP